MRRVSARRRANTGASAHTRSLGQLLRPEDRTKPPAPVVFVNPEPGWGICGVCGGATPLKAWRMAQHLVAPDNGKYYTVAERVSRLQAHQTGGVKAQGLPNRCIGSYSIPIRIQE